MHRDITPDSLLLAPGDVVKITNFGLLQATRAAADAELPFVSLHVPAHNEPPDMVIETLRALARLPLATYTRNLLSDASPRGDSPPADGEVVNEVDCVFHDLPLEAGVPRAVCRALARTMQNGGLPGRRTRSRGQFRAGPSRGPVAERAKPPAQMAADPRRNTGNDEIRDSLPHSEEVLRADRAATCNHGDSRQSPNGL
jgi:serine/threonine protein kinase